MPPPRSTSNRRLVVGLLLVLAAIFALLTAAQGVAINMVSTLVDHTWVEEHRRLVFTAFGVLAAINLLLAVVITWLTYRASQPDSLASDHSGPHAEIAGGHGGIAIGAIYSSGTPGSAGAPNRSVMVEGDMADSIVATGDNATIIILPATQDQAPSTPRSRTDLLDELVAESHARTVARWQAAGLPSELARELAEDLSIGALPPQLAEFPPGCVRVLEGHLGIGKSLLGERLHRQHIQCARLHEDAPIPLWLHARKLREDLSTTVVHRSPDLGDPHRTGAAVVVDGLDEDGSGSAGDLIEQARILVHMWPATRVLLTTRPGPPSNDDERIDAPLLTDDQADALVQRIATDDQSFDQWLWRWPDEARTALRETLRTPLFAIIMGILRREGQGAPLSPAELVESLVDRGLHIATRGRPGHTEQTIRGLLCRLAVATTQRNGRLPLVELGSSDDQAAVLASRLVAQEGATLAFPLPLLEQWFAAQALLEGLVDLAPVVDDLRRLEPWRWPLVMATRVGAHQPITRLLAPLAGRHPGLAGWIVHQAEESYPWRRQPPAAPPPARESAQRLRDAMQAWVAGFGPLASEVGPVTADGRLQPIGAHVDGTRLTTAWYRGGDDLPVIVDLPPEGFPWRGARSGWWLRQSSSPGSASTWAWPWTMDILRARLEHRLRRRTLRPGPGGVLEREGRWRLSNAILGRGRGSVRPVEVDHVLAIIRDKLADVPPDAVSASFGFSGVGTLTDRDLRQLAADLEGSGLSTIEPLWEPPDLPREAGRWVWSSYSPAALLRRTQQVYQGALDAYAELVDQYFPAWRPTLSMAAWMPLRLQGILEPAAGDDEPALSWSVIPLESGSANRVEIELADRMPALDWDAHLARQRRSHEALQRWRPEVVPYVQFIDHYEGLDIFGSRPATLLAYEWLSDDLHQLGWLKFKISHHGQD